MSEELYLNYCKVNDALFELDIAIGETAMELSNLTLSEIKDKIDEKIKEIEDAEE
tara:strand:- start:208 stop:372 length:165 start_codon:yes stop_codon:yes gene_type:complete